MHLLNLISSKCFKPSKAAGREGEREGGAERHKWVIIVWVQGAVANRFTHVDLCVPCKRNTPPACVNPGLSVTEMHLHYQLACWVPPGGITCRSTAEVKQTSAQPLKNLYDLSVTCRFNKRSTQVVISETDLHNTD